jgi:hypothetical protein
MSSFFDNFWCNCEKSDGVLEESLSVLLPEADNARFSQREPSRLQSPQGISVLERAWLAALLRRSETRLLRRIAK